MTVYGIIGTRTFNDYHIFENHISCIHDITHIISGGADGTDTLAHRYATEHNIPITIYPAEWSKYGRSAGPIRNRLIVENSDIIVAFWDYKSPGTKSSINIAKELNKPYHIICTN